MCPTSSQNQSIEPHRLHGTHNSVKYLSMTPLQRCKTLLEPQLFNLEIALARHSLVLSQVQKWISDLDFYGPEIFTGSHVKGLSLKVRRGLWVMYMVYHFQFNTGSGV